MGEIENGEFEHFMLKEIHEQPEAIRKTLAGRIKDSRVEFSDLEFDNVFKNTGKIIIAACGTSYHAGMVGRLIIEKLARIPVEIDLASEFRYREVLWNPNDLVIVISQSGETSDTLAALREARHNGIKVLAITNVPGSTIAQEAERVIYTHAGPEIAIASTKAYSAQLLIMYLLALYLASLRESCDPPNSKTWRANSWSGCYRRECLERTAAYQGNGREVSQGAEHLFPGSWLGLSRSHGRSPQTQGDFLYPC